MSNTQSYVPMIGVDMLHYAKLKTDTSESYETETPIAVLNTTEAGFGVGSQSASFYADNKLVDIATTTGDIDVAIAVADVIPSMKADIYGYDYSETGVLSGGNLNPPYIAYAYRIQKSNGAYRYVRIFKTKASPNEERVQTKGGSINFQTNGFSAKAAVRAKDSQAFETLDSDDPKLPTGVTNATIESKWFSDFTWNPTKTNG